MRVRLKRSDAYKAEKAVRDKAFLLGRGRHALRMRIEGKTLKATGIALGVSSERIRQIEGKCLRVLGLDWPHSLQKDREEVERRLWAFEQGIPVNEREIVITVVEGTSEPSPTGQSPSTSS